jgi:hypothetical protein
MALEQSRKGERAEVCLTAVSDRAVTAVMPQGILRWHLTMIPVRTAHRTLVSFPMQDCRQACPLSMNEALSKDDRDALFLPFDTLSRRLYTGYSRSPLYILTLSPNPLVAK